MRQRTLVTLDWLKALVSLLAGDARDRRESLSAFASHRILVSLTEERCVVPSSAAKDGFCPASGRRSRGSSFIVGVCFLSQGGREGGSIGHRHWGARMESFWCSFHGEEIRTRLALLQLQEKRNPTTISWSPSLLLSSITPLPSLFCCCCSSSSAPPPPETVLGY